MFFLFVFFSGVHVRPCVPDVNRLQVIGDRLPQLFRPVLQWTRNVSIKKLNSKDTRQNITQQASQLFKPNFQKNEKKITCPILGQSRPQKNSGGCLVRSGEIAGPR